MAWITDGSIGFSVKGDMVSYTDEEGVDNIFNCMWQEDDGVSSGKHYWKIHFIELQVGAGVGLTSKDCFKQGYSCKAIVYSGNLSNSLNLLVQNFGPSPSAGDVIGILAVFEDDRLKMYIDVNGKSLGLAFDVPASIFKTVFPIICFHQSGSATCTKQTDIPDIIARATTTFSSIEGDWKLIHFEENNIVSKLDFSPTCTIKAEGTNTYAWNTRVVNTLGTSLSKENGTWKKNHCRTTLMLGPAEMMKVESSIIKLMENVSVVEVDVNGNLSVNSDTVSTVWERYDATPGPFVGDPFE